MAEALTKKKRIQAGHKASTTKTMGKIDDILGRQSRYVHVFVVEVDFTRKVGDYKSP